MHQSKKIKVYGTVIVALLIAAVVLRVMTPSNTAKPPPSAPGYYTGPMRGKGNPNLAATEDGKQVDLPPLKETPATSAKETSATSKADPKSESSSSKKDTP